MNVFLDRQAYQDRAELLQLPSLCCINGQFVPARTGSTFQTVNPATGKRLADLPSCTQADVDDAVASARAAFEDGRWSLLHPTERKAILLRLATLIEDNLLDLAIMESLDSGKTIFDCQTVDLPETVKCLRWHAELIDKIYDQVSPPSQNHMAMIIREPVGVVGLVLPWNFPLLMLAWKIGPALAAGCCLVVKPAEETSLTTLRIAELALQAGIPAGVFNVVTGTGPEVGEPIGRHSDIDMVSFTGSTETGRRFLNFSAESNLKEIVLEMGGKNPCIVMDDAETLEDVANHVANGAYWNMGENCSAISRLIVHRAVKSELVEKLIDTLKSWKIGDPLDPESRIGPLVSPVHFTKVSSFLESKAKYLYGGNTYDGRYVQPTIIELKNHTDRLAREEVFGPLLALIVVDSFDEAIKIANDTAYGLTASIFTANGKRAMRAARLLKAGTVTVNSFGEGDITTPFGGYKQSGFGGRDNAIHAHDQYTQIKTIWFDLASP